MNKDNKARIKVTGISRPTLWYRDAIGSYLDVYLQKSGDAYLISDIDNRKDCWRFVSVEDYKPIQGNE